jgi:hypothetical protein
MRQLTALIVGGVALAAAVQGCSEEAALYLGGPPGPIADLQVSSSKLILAMGESAVIGASGFDAVGNATADVASFTSCDGSVAGVSAAAEGYAGFTTAATVQASGLGNSCVVVQAGGLVDTVLVSFGPVRMAVTGPDTIASGTEGAFTVTPLDAAGEPISGTAAWEWKSSSTALLSIDIASGVAKGKSPGTAAARIFAPGGADAFKNVVIVPGVFGGTLSAASAAPGSLITVNRAATGNKFDADVTARVGTTNAYVDVLAGDWMIFAVPARNSTAATTLLLSNMGSAQIAETIAFTVTSALQDTYGPANLDPTLGPDVDVVKSPARNIYSATSGLCSGGVGADCDDFFTITAGATARTVTATLTWTNSAGVAGDLDILWCNADCSAYTGNFNGAGSAKPEVSTVTIPANTTWRFWINNYAQTAAQYTNAKVTFSN